MLPLIGSSKERSRMGCFYQESNCFALYSHKLHFLWHKRERQEEEGVISSKCYFHVRMNYKVNTRKAHKKKDLKLRVKFARVCTQPHGKLLWRPSLIYTQTGAAGGCLLQIWPWMIQRNKLWSYRLGPHS